MANILKIFKNNNKLRADQVYYDNTTSILEAIWPIGRGFIDFTDTDYSNYLGFTWERELVGMTAVGLDTSQTEFNAVGKTGGSKYLQEHNHAGLYALYADNIDFECGLNANGTNIGYCLQFTKGVDGGGYFKVGKTGSGNSGNLQPYKVVAYWKRVS